MSAPGDRIVEILTEAESFAREAGELTLRYFGRAVDVATKEDGTPVTVADRKAEALLRTRIEQRFPGHGILGEEQGESGEGADVRWIVDPIDGTKSFVAGVPLYGVLIGVEIEGVPSIGIAHFPALGETVVAGRGLGARFNGRPCSVSSRDDLSRSLLLTTDAGAIADSPVGNGWRALRKAVAVTRTWGDAYGHILVATGRAEIMVDPELSPWDAAPLLPILGEAGGRFTSLEDEATIHGGSGISTNGLLHAAALERLRASLGMGAAD